MIRVKNLLVLLATALCMLPATAQSAANGGDYVTVTNAGGPTLGYSPTSGVKLLKVDGLWFKDLNRSGKLDPYEDWRLPAKERARDLASRMTIDQIAGLMLYSNHQAVPATSYDVSTYDGQPYEEGVTVPWLLTDHQKKFLRDDNLRHVLVTIIKDPATAARWNNALQAYVEGLGLGIPANNSSDPRNTARADAEFNAGGGGKISMWPGQLGLGATFSPELVKRFGQVASQEYRALGLATTLSPQVDICTEPRWNRSHGTFGCDPHLAADLGRAYIDGFQTTPGSTDGWGLQSVNCMVKHWPGGGPVESGRDAHYGFGKFAVYPGHNYALHKQPFLEGAFKLQGPTHQASAVMPYYTVSYGQGSLNAGNGYDPDIIGRQLRQDAGYDGVVCTDWLVTADEIHPGIHGGKPWGFETSSVALRHYQVLMAGCDQFGGNNDKLPVLQAYTMGVARHGKQWMDERMRQSARRLLMNVFRTGLFENPYVSPERAAQVVGCPQFMREGFEAQIKSIVMLKNHGHVLPLAGGKKARVYVPKRHLPAYTDFWASKKKERTWKPVSDKALSGYCTPVGTPDSADVAVVFIDSPFGTYGYSLEKARAGQNPYEPISLQYGDYTATAARSHSIAGGDPFEADSNRCYKGQTVRVVNAEDLDLVAKTRKSMGKKPVIVVVDTDNPFVPAEIEPLADALLLTFGIQNQAVLEVISGRHEPSGLLPVQMPKSMLTVERHNEDTPFDLDCYTDADGNTYDFAFGLNWKGKISDARTAKYARKR